MGGPQPSGRIAAPARIAYGTRSMALLSNAARPDDNTPACRPHSPPRIFISAAEPSADLHAANLVHAFRQRRPGTRFAGIAGPRMQAAGCTVIDNLCDRSAMLLAVVGSLWRAPGLLRRVNETLRPGAFDAAVFIDSPFLHLKLAPLVRSRRIPLLYYIAPQTWAWDERRLGRMRRCIDRLAVILPFEEKYFRDHGIPATYVGHPLFDALMSDVPAPERVAELRAGGSPVVAIFPGSRPHEVHEVFPGQLEVAVAIRKRFRDARFLVSVAHDAVAALVGRYIRAAGVSCECLRMENAAIAKAADLALVKSGTTTLELAYHHTPMIVMYNHSRLGYELVGKWLIKTKYLSLPNILAEREIVPEFMPYYRSTRPIAERAIELLSTQPSLDKMRGELEALMTPIVKTGASDHTAELLDELITAPAR